MKYHFPILFFIATLTASAQVAPNQPMPAGFSATELAKVDSIVNVYLKKYKVPGLSFTIAQNDSIKLQRTYGYADSVKQELLQPNHLFRIASISKPITATAIMQLVEQGKISLPDKVFGKGGILGTTYGQKSYSGFIKAISVRDLLEHLAGGWSNDDSDPMFQHPEMSQSQLINWTLDNQPLAKAPGTDYAYSNFGYCVLGRVIEKVSGMKYEDYVQKNILAACGISDMAIGGNTLTERKPNEVRYYDLEEDPYTMDQRRMDSHGGWIATPTDLVKFLIRVDKFPQKADILQPATLDTMFTPSSINKNYAKGWAVNKQNNYWHNGSLPGQQSVAARINDGFCWAVMVNTRKDEDFALELDQLMWKIKRAIKHWPAKEIAAN